MALLLPKVQLSSDTPQSGPSSSFDRSVLGPSPEPHHSCHYG
jgi:hypothetical protein